MKKIKVILAYILICSLPPLFAWVMLIICGYPAGEMAVGVFGSYFIVLSALYLIIRLITRMLKYLLEDE